MESFSKVVANCGYDVTVITVEGDKEEFYSPGNGRKSYKVRLPGERYLKKSIFLFNSSVAQFLDDNNFNIVHINSSCKWYFLIKLFSRTKAKFIYHSMSYPLAYSAFERKKRMLINSIMAKFMDRFIFQTIEAKNHYLGMRRAKNTEIIPVGFCSETLYPEGDTVRISMRKKFNIEGGKKVIVFTGSLSKFRKLDTLVQAFQRVVKAHPETILLVIGDGDAKQDLQNLADSLHIEKNVIFTGLIPHEELRNHIAVADIGLAYVPIDENYTYNPPLKTFEYLACGLPVIATNTVSNASIIKEGYNGIITNDTENDIANSIITLIEDKVMMGILKNRAVESITEYEFKVIVKEKLIPLYETLQ
jgi:glycosyltransferase involved in cell wall biosynthesis